MSLSKLRDDLSQELRPVYVIVNDARPIVEQALAMIRDAVTPRLGLPAFNHDRFRASEPNASDAFSAARTLPVMADRRLVEILQLDEAPKPLVESLVAYLAAPVDTTVFVVSGPKYPKIEKLNAKLKIVKALEEAGLDEPLKFDADATPLAFVKARIEAQGKTIDRGSAETLVAAVGTDLGQLEAEVDKLVTFVGEERAVTAVAVAAATSITAAAINWDLTAGLAARDVALTLATLQRMQNDGSEPRQLLILVTWQMLQLAQARERLLAGASDGNIAKELRMRSGVLRKVKPYLRDGFPDSAELLRRIATANRQMNSHRAGAERLLEGLIFEMLTGRLRRPPPVPRPR